MDVLVLLCNISIVFLSIGNYFLNKRLNKINERLILVESNLILEELYNRVASASGTEYDFTKGE